MYNHVRLVVCGVMRFACLEIATGIWQGVRLVRLKRGGGILTLLLLLEYGFYNSFYCLLV